MFFFDPIPLKDKEIKIKAKINKHCHDLLFGKNIKKLNLEESFIISNEGLSAYLAVIKLNIVKNFQKKFRSFKWNVMGKRDI